MPEETHEQFLENLEASLDGVWLVARWLQAKGYAVTVNPTRRAPRHKEWEEYADNGDIEIRQRIEVKQLSYRFSGRHDWPFGEKFIVCAKHSFDRARPKPFAYIIISGCGGYFALVKADTAGQWYVETIKDIRYGSDYEQESYLCPLDLVKFGPLRVREGKETQKKEDGHG